MGLVDWRIGSVGWRIGLVVPKTGSVSFSKGLVQYYPCLNAFLCVFKSMRLLKNGVGPGRNPGGWLTDWVGVGQTGVGGMKERVGGS